MDTECGHYMKLAYSLVTYFILPSVPFCRQAQVEYVCGPDHLLSVSNFRLSTFYACLFTHLFLRELIVVKSLTGF